MVSLLLCVGAASADGFGAPCQEVGVSFVATILFFLNVTMVSFTRCDCLSPVTLGETISADFRIKSSLSIGLSMLNLYKFKPFGSTQDNKIVYIAK